MSLRWRRSTGKSGTRIETGDHLTVDGQPFLQQFPRMTLADFPQLKRLPPRQRLNLAEQLWDSAASASLTVPASHKQLISARRKSHAQGQIATLTMDELKKSIRRHK